MLDNFSRRRLKAIKKFCLLLLGVLFLFYFSGCSSVKHYKVLSFFFDGVPDPDKKDLSHLNDSIIGKDSTLLALNHLKDAGPKTFTHTPYQDKQCNACHDPGSMGKLIKSMPELCYDCHEDFGKKYTFLHGPVGGGQCTMCHNTHTSPNANLLIRTGQKLCTHCHDDESLSLLEPHRQNKDENCTECHNPHGGENLNLTR
ncbi:MAG: hypothetical protein HXX13_06390 [Bacteroidetes bacterium]|nr:hypothetical protein [Bacteroidota bacterium]